MPAKKMPIFTRMFDLLAWLLPMTNHFPRTHRQTMMIAEIGRLLGGWHKVTAGPETAAGPTG